MKHFFVVGLIALAGSASLPRAAMSQDDGAAASLADSLKSGKAAVSLRYRLENVSNEARTQDATASTLRTTLAYRSAPYKKFSLFLEAENVAVVGDDSYYNRGAGDLSDRMFDRPVVADPALRLNVLAPADNAICR